jgi:rod shape-determining protein MreC
LNTLRTILSTFKEYVTLAACIVVALNLLAMNNTPQIRELRSAAIAGIGMLQEPLNLIPNVPALRRENAVLRERNLHLANEVSLLREAKLENFRLRRLLGLKERLPFTYIAANVIGKNQQPMRTTITLDVGERDGVKQNMAVVTDAGLVGKVAATSGGYSVAQILRHKDVRVSAQVERERVDGIVYWDGDERILRMKNTPRSANVKPGDVVVTSPYSSIFPPGIRIGIVSRVTLEQGALFHTIDVVPAVDFTRLEEVFVITRLPDSSRVVLEQRMK